MKRASRQITFCIRLMLLLLSATVLCSGTAYSADNASSAALGRLFFTPAQRQQADRVREGLTHGRDEAAGTTAHSAPSASASPAVAASTEKSADSRVTEQASAVRFNGVVVRDDGKHTYWINNHATTEGDPRVGVDNSAFLHGTTVRLRTDGATVTLKPGQLFDAADGKVRDGFEAPSRPAKKLAVETGGPVEQGVPDS